MVKKTNIIVKKTHGENSVELEVWDQKTRGVKYHLTFEQAEILSRRLNKIYWRYKK